MFYTLPSSLKIFLNLCLLSCKINKKSANCQILKSEVKSLKYSVVLFPSLLYLSFYKYIIFLWLLEAHEAILQSYFEQASSLVYLVHPRAGLQNNIKLYSTYSTEDNINSNSSGCWRLLTSAGYIWSKMKN